MCRFAQLGGDDEIPVSQKSEWALAARVAEGYSAATCHGRMISVWGVQTAGGLKEIHRSYFHAALTLAAKM